jgi:hypothetical protein
MCIRLDGVSVVLDGSPGACHQAPGSGPQVALLEITSMQTIVVTLSGGICCWAQHSAANHKCPSGVLPTKPK